jgi:hypothetical protein
VPSLQNFATAIALIALAMSWLPLFESSRVPEKTPDSLRFHTEKVPDVSRVHTKKTHDLIQFHTIEWGRGLGQAGLIVVNDEAQWSSLWTQLCTTGTHAIDPATGQPVCPTLPPIDFTTRTVLAVSAGLEGNTGFAINVTRLIEFRDHLHVLATLTTDGPRCVYAQMIVYPGHIVDIPKTDLPATLTTISIQAPGCPLPSAWPS